MTDILKEEIKNLAQRKDMKYVTEFLVPLLYMEADQPICIHLYDSLNKKFLIEPTKIYNLIC
jgi:hypothetical protein